MEYFLIAGAVAVFAGILGSSVRQKRKLREEWGAVAAKYKAGLKINGDQLKIRLEDGDVEIHFDGSWTHIVLQCDFPGIPFRVSRGAFSSSGKRKGVQLGANSIFENLFVVEAKDEITVGKILTAELQGRIVSCLSGLNLGTVEHEGMIIRLTRLGSLGEDEINEAIRLLNDLQRAAGNCSQSESGDTIETEGSDYQLPNARVIKD